MTIRGRLSIFTAAIVGMIGARHIPDSGEVGAPSLDIPKSALGNGSRGGHPGSKALSTTPIAKRARVRFEKRRKRDSRRGKYTTRGI